jgi:predicted transcriptional regulator
MTNRRSRLEIYVDIMDEIMSGTIKPTRIMYRANLSWKPLQQMLKALIDQELVEEYAAEEGDERTDKVYRITDKGRDVLEYFGKAKALVEQKRPIEIMNWR